MKRALGWKMGDVEERQRGLSTLSWVSLGHSALQHWGSPLEMNTSPFPPSSVGQKKERPPPVPNPDYEVTGMEWTGRGGEEEHALLGGREQVGLSLSHLPDTLKALTQGS